MARCRRGRWRLVLASLVLLPGLAGGAVADAEPGRLRLFDAHLHYTGVDAASLSPRDIVGILDRAGIDRAVVTGTPTHAERILVGVDTYWTRRWLRLDEVADQIRGWLGQLPPAVAARLAHGNAEALFGGIQGAGDRDDSRP